MPLTDSQKEIVNKVFRDHLDFMKEDLDALRKVRTATNAQVNAALAPRVNAIKAGAQTTQAELPAKRAAQDAQLTMLVNDCDAVLAALLAGNLS